MPAYSVEAGQTIAIQRMVFFFLKRTAMPQQHNITMAKRWTNVSKMARKVPLARVQEVAREHRADPDGAEVCYDSAHLFEKDWNIPPSATPLRSGPSASSSRLPTGASISGCSSP